MAEVTESLALLSLEDDLTCSICLCPFTEPVSLRCGHSFCRVCLEETWSSTSSYFCPHCREHYPTKPQLKKNTVLSAVVETFRAKAGSGVGSDGGGGVVPDTAAAMTSPRPELKPIMCDMCSNVKAVKTCLTCITSFCSEHVRPHQENPLFRAHELCEPLNDLTDRLCSQHGKLMEFFCSRHERSICSSCLQQSHKECSFSSPAERRMKIEGMAVVRKRAMEAEYQQIREMLQRDEREAMDALDIDLESGNTKLNTLMKKFNQNIEKMSSTRVEINNLLAKSDSPDFLQVSVELPSVVNFDPYSPRITLDSKRVIAFHSSIVSLKEQINKILREPVEYRISILKPGVCVCVCVCVLSCICCDMQVKHYSCDLCFYPRHTQGSTPGEEPGTSNHGSQPKGAAGEGKRKPRTIPVNLNQASTIGPVARSELLKWRLYRMSRPRTRTSRLASPSARSRLGRNSQSWCIEWFNVKLSAWHNSSETVLVNPDPRRVGVLLDCDIGSATFYHNRPRPPPSHLRLSSPRACVPGLLDLLQWFVCYTL
ncbi:E3 ubiquitin/ISG15 ligase TRIM25 [Bagarius yarrelli]|uniref:E3 ubiquitin/ISG15 ligase TRIM25 n=1 Tax=Bagarius yarrelli TaxID=175774 RepID=A0A556VXP1_BAGYA|nr:E3 ubiquitin/ISG15 ligase TRIM25 [Bagarius yarrelli]